MLSKKVLKADMDKAIVLNFIRQTDSLSRTNIKNVTGMRMATVSNITKELLKENFIQECGHQDSSGGRKQELLRLNPEKGFIIGVEFWADFIVAVVSGLDGKVIYEKHEDIANEPTKEYIIDRIVILVREVIKEAGIQPDKVMGLGIADPGLVDRQHGISIASSTIQSWHDVHLQDILEQKTGYAVLVENGADAKTIAESRFGVGRDSKHVLFIEYRTGIGCGIISEGRLFRGFCESAGELGHMRVSEDEVVCGCGSYGCLEAVATQQAIINRVRKIIGEGARSLAMDFAGGELEKINIDNIFAAAQQNDKVSLSALDNAGKYLGIAIANAINLFNPEMVIFDSRFDDSPDFLERIKKIIIRQALHGSTQKLKFKVSELGDKAGPLGVIALWLDRTFKVPGFMITGKE